MADLGAQIQQAKTAGYSDADIAAHLATDPTLGPKVAQAKAAGYADADIVSHLASTSPVPAAAPQNAWQHAGQLIANEFHGASDAYRADVQAAGAKAAQGKPLGLGDMAAPVLDAARAALSPIKGAADAALGDKSLHLPPKILGVDVPQWAQDINSKGLTGGDLATFALPVGADLAAARGVGQAAKAAGIGTRTMENSLAASKAPASIASTNPVRNDLAPVAKAAPSPVSATPTAATPVIQAIKNDPAATVEALGNAKTAAYGAVDKAGVQYTPQALDRLIQDATSDLQSANLSDIRHPKAASMLADIQGMKGKSPTLTDLDQLRQVVRRDVAGPRADDAEKFMGNKIIDHIDDFVQNAKATDTVGGDAAGGANLIGAARQANAQYKKAESISDALSGADMRTGATGSGANIDNATRQRVLGVYNKVQNWTPDERTAIQDLVKGGPVQNAMRAVGKLSPATGGLNALGSVALTTATHGTAGLPLLATSGVKMAADMVTKAKVNNLMRLIAAGGKQENVIAQDAWATRLSKAAQNSPAALSSTVGRLRSASAANPALLPVYQQSLKLLQPPAQAAAGTTNPQQ